jgi:transposase
MKSLDNPLKNKRTNCNKVVKTAILNARKAGMEIGTIVTLFGVSRATVFRIMRSFRLTGKIEDNACYRSGRKKKTSPEMDSFIVESVEENRKMIPSQIRALLEQKFGLSVNLSLIKRRLLNAGLYGRVCLRKPLLAPINKLKRLVWAVKHKDWTVDQWRKVLWSDEKKFELFNTKRREYCRRKKNEALRGDTVQRTVKHGGGGLMFWGCVGNTKTGNLTKIEGIMDQHIYRDILAKEAIPSGQKIFGTNEWIFQQDNDPKHRSKLCRTFMEDESKSKNFSLMDWPPQSPDLSPIELLWDEVDRQVQAKRSSNMVALEHAVIQVWENISHETVEKLLKRMPLLCKAVVKAQGGYFHESLSQLKREQMSELKKVAVYK